MNRELVDIRRRRAELVEQAAQQRDELSRRVRAGVAWFDASTWISAAWRVVRSRPFLIGGAVALFVVLRPKRVIAWSARIWTGWQAFRRVGRLVVGNRPGARGAPPGR